MSGFSYEQPSPASLGYAMLPEWAPHLRTWMIFPPATYEGSLQVDQARRAWCAVARAVSRFEPVVMCVRGEDLDFARDELGDTVEFVVAELDDAWARDVAPTFVSGPRGTLAIDWRFNGWGQQSWASWERDDRLAARIAEHSAVPAHRSRIVNEGGGIEVDGAGLVVVTETVQLDPGRNGPESRELVEDELRACLGVEDVLWLERGLAGDYREFGTRGHVDLLCKFVGPRRALVHSQRNKDHPDHAVTHEVRTRLVNAGVEVIELPAPTRLEADGRVCDWSYVNCSFVNGGLIAGVFGDAADAEALDVLRSALPGREVVAVDARTLFALGGGVHCITQQQPAEEVAR